MTSNSLLRTTFISFVILGFASILIGKLFLIQIVHSNSYSQRADRQYATPSSDIFERGTIYFLQKDNNLVSAAVQTMGYKIAIDPTKITDAENIYKQLSEMIILDHDIFISQTQKKNDPYEEIASRVTKEQADKISAKKIPGISVFKEKWRFYPGNNLASHTLGFVGFKGDDLGGRYGLERSYDDILSRSKDNPYVNFFAEVFSDINKTFFSNEEKSGDIVTTIEPTVQGFLEKIIGNVKQKYNVDSIGGIIMNPTDGSIYALAASPDFNPNDFSVVKNTSTFANPFVESVFEFGSVVKPLVMAGALDAKVVTAETTYTDNGFVNIENHRINNFDKKARGPNTPMQEVLTQSLNTGMVYVYQHLGKQKMYDYMMGYGLKDKTGIDLPNETSGLVSNLSANLKNKKEIEYANASFGQGIAMTPIEITRALASLGNGGNLVVPHLVQKIKYNDGTEKELTYPTTPTKISKKTSEEITRMLVAVMDKSFDKLSPGIERYSIAVKTGTAQVANREGGGYYLDRHTHSFFGYFPAYNPKFIVFLYAVNPKGIQYASQTWALPFLDISKFLLNYYEIPPDR